MKKFRSVLCFLLCAAAAFSLAGCGGSTSPAPTPVPTATEVPANERISSVETYNRTGRIQREDFYEYSGSTASISYSEVYSYSDAGNLTEIKRSAGGLGSDKILESRLYSGGNCTQRILYDSSGSTQSVTYYTYDKKGVLTKERIVEMIPAESGYGSSGKTETVITYEDGLAAEKTVTAPGDYSRIEYAYTQEGLLCRESAYHSSDGKTFRLFDVYIYEYDASGELVRKISQDAQGTVSKTETWEYSDAGLLTQEASYSSADLTDSTRLSRTLYEYSEEGALTFSSTSEGEETVYTYYEYDSSGNLITESAVRYVAGELTDTAVTTRQYDARSNLVREATVSPDGTERVDLVCKYEYYSDGRIQSKTNYECY